jgi:hypothetical protein
MVLYSYVKGVGLRPNACLDRRFESHWGHRYFSCRVFVLSGRGFCDWLIPRPGESYRMWCVFEYDKVKNQKVLYTYCEQGGRRGKDYETKHLCYQTLSEVILQSVLTSLIVSCHLISGYTSPSMTDANSLFQC